MSLRPRGVKTYTLDWDDGDPKDKEKSREELRPRGGGPVLSAPGPLRLVASGLFGVTPQARLQPASYDA